METTSEKRPKSIRNIFIINALLVLICFTFYLVFINVEGGPVTPQAILYTALAYTGFFIVNMVSIHKKWQWVLRASLLGILLVSLPTGAFIGIGLAIVMLIISFRKSAKMWFAA